MSEPMTPERLNAIEDRIVFAGSEGPDRRQVPDNDILDLIAGSKQLQRERDEAREELAAVEAGAVSIAAAIDMEINDLRSQLAAMQRERDEARAELKAMKDRNASA